MCGALMTGEVLSEDILTAKLDGLELGAGRTYIAA
jgi:hypothetical protein